MPFPTGAAITAGAGLLGSAFGIGSGRRQYRRNKKLMKYEHSLNKKMFDYQNAYNTPSMQMQRLKDAGLNPALMYGQGTTGNASDYPKARAIPSDVHTFDPTQAIAGVASAMNQVLQQKQIDNLDSQQKETDSRTFLNLIDGAVKGGTMKEAKGLVKYQLENLKSDNKNKLQSLQNLRLTENLLNKDLTKKQIEIEDAKIKKAMNSRDLQWMKENNLSRLDTSTVKLVWRMANGSHKLFSMLLKEIVLGSGGNRPWKD